MVEFIDKFQKQYFHLMSANGKIYNMQSRTLSLSLPPQIFEFELNFRTWNVTLVVLGLKNWILTLLKFCSREFIIQQVNFIRKEIPFHFSHLKKVGRDGRQIAGRIECVHEQFWSFRNETTPTNNIEWENSDFLKISSFSGLSQIATLVMIFMQSMFLFLFIEFLPNRRN